jgi:Tetratricopeptide repeat
VKTQSGENLKPRSQYVEDAIRLAMDSRWDEAAELNQFILENFGSEDQTHNRMGKALTELGRLEEARDHYDRALKLNPFNQVAKKNRSKLEVLIQHNDSIKTGGVKVDLNLFVEEMGKTVITILESVEPDICDRIVAGDVAELEVRGDGIVLRTLRGVRLGELEAKLARRLSKFIQGGNRYQAGVTSCEGGEVRVIVRETYQDPAFVGKPSFPQRQKREVAFRPYARGSLITRDVEVYSTDDEDEEDIAHASAEMDMDEDEGMHEVDEESDSMDFADDDLGGDDDGGEDDE